MAPGGPASYVSPAAGEHGSVAAAPVATLLETAVLRAEELASGLVKKVITPAGEIGTEILGISAAAIARTASLTLGLVLTPTNSCDDPGYASEWELYRRNHAHLTPLTPAQLRLAQLERLHEQGDLTREEEAELITLLGLVKGIHIQKLAELTDKTPFGFSSAEEFAKAGEELRVALKESGLHYKSIGVRGSSVTGLSSKGGAFRVNPQNGFEASDVDAFVELSEDIDLKASENIPGFIHPNKLFKRYPALKNWSRKWTQKLGREITPGAFKPGTFTDKDIIPFK